MTKEDMRKRPPLKTELTAIDIRAIELKGWNPENQEDINMFFCLSMRVKSLWRQRASSDLEENEDG